MSAGQAIIRIAAKGDGVTADGQHVAGAVPGDVILPDGSLQHGLHHATPPCRHYAPLHGRGCGGCQLQHVDEKALRQFVTDRVAHAAAGQGVEVQELLLTHLSPSYSRRRATLHAMRVAKGAVIGFKEAGSHQIVDLAECHILRPELFALLPALREFVARHGSKGVVDIELTLCDQGVDCGLRNIMLDGLGPTEAALDLAREQGLARLTVDQGYGLETVWEPEPVTVKFGDIPVPLPPGAFLQATTDGEERLIGDAREWLDGAGAVADLFSGIGTFAFALSNGRKVLAAEAAREAHLACKSAAARAGRAIGALHRDLFRNPLMPDELNRFDAVLLDPPRAGAREQVARLAESRVNRVVYISCNPSSWARDAKQLVAVGYRLEKLRPVGQFRWSNHVELSSCFVR